MDSLCKKKGRFRAAFKFAFSETAYEQIGSTGFGVTVRNEISNDRSERSGVCATDPFTLASCRQGRVGFGVTVRNEINSERSERSGVSATDLLTFPVVPIQQLVGALKSCQ